MESPTPIAYLDTSIISGFAKQDLKRPELNALFDLLGQFKSGAVQIVTSKVAHDELLQNQGDARYHEALYNLLIDVPLAAENDPSGMMLMGVGGGEDALFTKLKALLPDLEDARHIYQASKNDAGYFVTADEKTILRHAQEIDELCGIKARSPSQVVADLS